MIMKKNLAILGAGIVVGAVAYAVWYKINKANQTVESDCEDKNGNTLSATFTPNVMNYVTTADDVDAVKSAVAQNMAARHEEAARIMKDAVGIICKRSEVSYDETKELEQISNELDNLIGEE